MPGRKAGHLVYIYLLGRFLACFASDCLGRSQ
jgi:hypothetical protein